MEGKLSPVALDGRRGAQGFVWCLRCEFFKILLVDKVCVGVVTLQETTAGKALPFTGMKCVDTYLCACILVSLNKYPAYTRQRALGVTDNFG